MGTIVCCMHGVVCKYMFVVHATCEPLGGSMLQRAMQARRDLPWVGAMATKPPGMMHEGEAALIGCNTCQWPVRGRGPWHLRAVGYKGMEPG